MDSSFLLREASRPELHERDRIAHQSLGGRLSLEQYLEFRHLFREHNQANRRLANWVLCKGDMTVVSCDTIRFQSSLGDGEDHGTTELIANVYVEPGLRGKGYAAELISHLVARARRQGLQASMLFSEVGERLYAQFGYQALKSFNWIYSPDEAEKMSEAATANCEPVTLASVENLVLPQGLRTRGRFGLHMDLRDLYWHFEQSRFFAKAFNGPSFEAIGARWQNSYILWTHDYQNQQIVLLWTEFESREAAVALLQTALQEAFRNDFRQVQFASDPGNNGQVSFCRRGPVKRIPMILPISPLLRASDWTSAPFAQQY